MGDIKLFVMAILGVQGNKRMNIKNVKNFKTVKPYGWLNSKHQLCFTELDSGKVYLKYAWLRSLRLSFKTTYKRRRSCGTPLTFTPNLEKSAQSVSKGLKGRIPHRSSYSQRIINERVKSRRGLDECTFTPYINRMSYGMLGLRDRK